MTINFGSPAKITYFWGQYRFLSNFYPSPIWADFIQYPTVEHAFQAAKTEHIEEKLRIRDCRTPSEAKHMGRHVLIMRDWDARKVGVMRQLVHAKFQKGSLADKLMATGDAHLEEGNTWGDTFWGTVNGQGQNHLGKILMEVRNNLFLTQTCDFK